MKTVTVLGTGAIGAAVSRALMRRGHVVTVWNRSIDKTAELASEGACVAHSPADAIRASEIIILCLADLEASKAVLGNNEVEAAIAGKALVQLTSGTADDTLREADWVVSHGADYLKGSMLSFPRGIGTSHGLVFLSGSLSVFERHHAELSSIGVLQYVGAEYGAAGVFFTGAVWIHYASLYGLLQAAAYVDAHDVSIADVIGASDGALHRFIDEALEDESRRIDSRDYSGDEATITTHLAALEYVLDLPGLTAAGIDHGFAPGFKTLMEQAIARGDGSKDIAALFEVLRSSN